jgi:peptidoglycan/LPS O-acetylase OafA/YrhL
MNYRSEIDGLRALALLPVILFHAGVQAFRGGFVGVDVFFVISGYLITSIILTEQQKGTFSLMSFYERRARRILPPLFVVVFACILFAWLWMLPAEMEDLAKSVMAVSTFTSNLFFWKKSGYFAPNGQLEPLFHTWSLAVEEQYYLLYPLFLFLTCRMAKHWMVSLLIAVGIMSLASAQWGAFHMPGATFYFLPTRGWEFAIGVLVAFYLCDNGNRESSAQVLDQVASLVGILLIAYAVFAFDEQTPWPSLYTLAPTLGTALVILFTREHTIVGRLLSNRALVGIGLISYGAFLWHYPLFAFARIRNIDAPNKTTLLALTVTAMLFAYISWRYLEQPIRNRRVFRQNTIFLSATIGSSVLLLVGSAGYFTKGMPGRWDSQVLRMESTQQDHLAQLYAGGCHLRGSETKLTKCVRGESTATPAYAIWGDSHAGVLVHELEKSFVDKGLSALQYTKNDCPASVGLHVKPSKDKDSNCEQFTKFSIEDLADNQIQTVIIASRWLQYIEGHDGRQSLRVATNKNDLYAQPDIDSGAVVATYINAIRSLLEALYRVILIYPVPESEWDVPKSLVRLMTYTDLEPLSLAADYHRVSQRLNKINEAFDSIGDHPNLARIKPEKLLCGRFNRNCLAHLNGIPLYFDKDHLTNTGARLVVDEILEQLDS